MESPGSDMEYKHQLRKQAEEALQGKSIDLEGLPVKDIQLLLHELQVHQIELTLQNEELRRVQLEIETTRDQYSDLYNFAPVGYCTLDRKGRIVEANQTLVDLLAGDMRKLIHKKLSDFIVREDQDEYYLHHQRLFENRHHDIVNLQMVKLDKKRVFVRLESSMDHEDQSGIRVIVSDITAQKQMEIRLADYTRELERANEALRDFSFIVSHDLQEPLRKVKAFGSILEANFGEQLGAEGRSHIARMTSAANRMDGMLLGLLEYSRITSRELSLTEVDLKNIAMDVVSDLEALITETGGEVIFENLPSIKADPLLMRLLFQNFISNGIKYHRPGEAPFVRVSGSLVQDNKVQIDVRDNGIGFDMRYSNHIFEPFSRLNRKSEFGGSGMGLSICKKIIERHYGSISAHSVLGEGSTFTVTLPRSGYT